MHVNPTFHTTGSAGIQQITAAYAYLQRLSDVIAQMRCQYIQVLMRGTEPLAVQFLRTSWGVMSPPADVSDVQTLRHVENATPVNVSTHTAITIAELSAQRESYLMLKRALQDRFADAELLFECNLHYLGKNMLGYNQRAVDAHFVHAPRYNEIA